MKIESIHNQFSGRICDHKLMREIRGKIDQHNGNYVSDEVRDCLQGYYDRCFALITGYNWHDSMRGQMELTGEWV